MTREEIILKAADDMAEAAASSHFHNQGLLDDEVDPTEWREYTWKVRNAILDTVEKFQD